MMIFDRENKEFMDRMAADQKAYHEREVRRAMKRKEYNRKRRKTQETA
jgi:hypothetical protein